MALLFYNMNYGTEVKALKVLFFQVCWLLLEEWKLQTETNMRPEMLQNVRAVLTIPRYGEVFVCGKSTLISLRFAV